MTPRPQVKRVRVKGYGDIPSDLQQYIIEKIITNPRVRDNDGLLLQMFQQFAQTWKLEGENPDLRSLMEKQFTGELLQRSQAFR